MINILTQLKNAKDLSPNEKILSEYIINNAQLVVDMNVSTLSQLSYVSSATIYRLCDKLNVSGFSELKVKITRALNEYKEDESFDYNFPINSNDTPYQIIHKIKDDYDQTLINSLNMFDIDQLKFSILKMSKAKYIDIYTTAGNIYFAHNFKFMMKEIGIDVNVVEDDYYKRLSASASNKDRFALVITYEGRGQSIDNILKILNDNHTPILLIASKDYEPLYNVDYRLNICSYENHYKKISSYSTKLSILFILDIIYTTYFNLNYEDNINKKINYYHQMYDM